MGASGNETGHMAVVGMFDGVHIGHRWLLERLRGEASRRGLRPVAVTFPDHPLRVTAPGRAPRLLTPEGEKRRLLEGAGVEVLMIPFDDELRSTSTADFLRMLKREGVESVLLGFNNRFGHDAPRDFGSFRDIGREVGVEIQQCDALEHEGEAVSSSRIREAIAEGRMAEGVRMLNRGYAVEGTVVHGQALGRRIGFPTANVKPGCGRQLLPGRGVYAAEVVLADGSRHRGIVNVGSRPTLGEGLEETIEAHLPEFDGNLYGERVRAEFLRKIRDERRFGSVDELKAQIARDIEELGLE